MPVDTASKATLAGSAASLSDDLRPHPLAPGLQLVGRRGAERVGRAEHHRLPVADQ
jgi:hypothetical protein